ATRTLRAASTVVYPPLFLRELIELAVVRVNYGADPQAATAIPARHGSRRTKVPFRSSYSTTPVFYLVNQKPRNLVADLAVYRFGVGASLAVDRTCSLTGRLWQMTTSRRRRQHRRQLLHRRPAVERHRDGIVTRIVRAEVRRKVEYHLPEYGQSLCP